MARKMLRTTGAARAQYIYKSTLPPPWPCGLFGRTAQSISAQGGPKMTTERNGEDVFDGHF